MVFAIMERVSSEYLESCWVRNSRHGVLIAAERIYYSLRRRNVCRTNHVNHEICFLISRGRTMQFELQGGTELQEPRLLRGCKKQGSPGRLVVGGPPSAAAGKAPREAKPPPAAGFGNLLIPSQRLQTPPNAPSLNHCVVEGTSTPIRLISGLAKRNKLKMPSSKGATRRLLQSGAHTNPSPGMRIPRSQL